MRLVKKSPPDPDIPWMRLALAKARLGLGRTAPNPAVGAVIVKDGKLLASGWHKGTGLPHAEINAIRALANPHDSKDATIYVTLEPCSTHGRTPPCCDAIVCAGFKRVVIGTLDPNPLHAGAALQILQKAGIEVRCGVLESDAQSLIKGFSKWMRCAKPWVIAKVAMSLDGRIAKSPGSSPKISGPAADAWVHRLRAECDAILVGAGTVRQDNPRLTVRTSNGKNRRRQPWRIIAAGQQPIPQDCHLLNDEFSERTLVIPGADPSALLTELGAQGIQTLLVEGGGQLLGALFDGGHIDEFCAIIAPVILGGPTPSIGGLGVDNPKSAPKLDPLNYHRLGSDLLVQGIVQRANAASAPCPPPSQCTNP